MNVELTTAQRNILDIIVRETLITKGKNKGEVKAVIQVDSFDIRSFNGLITRGLVTWEEGIYGQGYVATVNAFTALKKSQ